MWQYLDEAVAIILIVGCLGLIFLGIDGEVKSILAMAAAWCFKGGVDRAKKPKQTPPKP